jgi:two-component sensor histidine kinase
VSALHRVGVHMNTEGVRFAELGLDEDAVRTAFAKRRPATEELERGHEITVLIRCIPLLDHGRVSGGLVLLRDISELRRRDRLLMSKDATIREIHHRVKNNLQTVAALLRLQARRVAAPEARAALEESVRRVASIALVHETLSMSADEVVEFDGIIDRVATAAAEVAAPESPVFTRREGTFGVLPAEMATPLVMVLNELLLNAVEHGFDGGAHSGEVVVHVERGKKELHIVVADNGRGLPEGFNPTTSKRLGLQIIRTLTTGELRGTIELRNRAGGGTEAVLLVPLNKRAV